MMLKHCQIPDTSLLNSDKLKVRIRYRSAPLSVCIEAVNGDSMMLRFSQPASAVTPGQSAVIYLDDLVVGGGIIGDTREKRKFKSDDSRRSQDIN
jgi:Predicted tRNA(5-methylaminomethyl-2-thiouridylate) methyltransferase, contains the PP-loop ATPase domain